MDFSFFIIARKKTMERTVKVDKHFYSFNIFKSDDVTRPTVILLENVNNFLPRVFLTNTMSIKYTKTLYKLSNKSIIHLLIMIENPNNKLFEVTNLV